MGDKKPKKKSSGSSDAHKAKLAKRLAGREESASKHRPDDKGKK